MSEAGSMACCLPWHPLRQNGALPLGGGEERQGPAHGRGIASLEPNRAIAASYLQPDMSSTPPATKVLKKSSQVKFIYIAPFSNKALKALYTRKNITMIQKIKQQR
ncbi:hypothetical protein ATANTOWER_024787 [Ataeniobius toweri]|uniref:Uncharacterized protein n=1 Tax=Ataeniobius toweri TaxID=208326 RepID=A0ABU7B2X2_9TELE|nr:hypothetical protein [Ataeniobius toweri]